LSRTAYDGINTDAETIKKIIKPGDVVMYYIDGRYAWSAAEIALFPHNLHVTITVLGGNADVADCETGDMTPEQAATWVVKRKAAGYDRPTIYRSLAGMPDIRKATGSLVMGKDWDAFVADYDRVPTQVYAGAAAKQYKNTAGYDVSEIYDDAWPHRSSGFNKLPPSPPIITTVKPKWPSGLTLVLGNKGNAVEALQQALANSGIDGVRAIASDGVFGLQTRTAVRNFEVVEKLSLDADGLALAGPQVRGKLINLALLNSAGQPTR
jgi:hypothetical protein